VVAVSSLYSLHRGAARPAYIVPGMLWIDDSGGAANWILKWYVSASIGDQPLFSLNTTTGLITFSGNVGGSQIAAAILLAQAATVPSVRWNNSGNALDAKAWRMTVLANGNLRLAAYTDAGTETQTFEFGRDGSLVRSAWPDSFHVYMTGDIGLSPGATAVVPMAGIFDNNGARWNAGSNNIVIDKAGLWQFNLTLGLAVDSPPCPMAAIIRKQLAGGSPVWDFSAFANLTATWVTSASVQIVQNMSAGDVVFPCAVNGSGSSGGHVIHADATGAFLSQFSGARLV
jgi:hypothetical protein